MTTLNQFVTRDQSTIRDSILRVIRNGLIQLGINNPNVTPGSDWFILATAVGLQCAVVEANCAIKSDALMPDTAVDDELGRWATILGLTKQAAAGSVGPVIITTSSATTIPSGAQLYDESGLRYQVVAGGIFADQSSVTIAALSTGSATDHDQGDILRWVDTPPFSDEKVVVGLGGLVNGKDDEDDEALRRRVLAYFQDPPASGNWEYAVELAEKSDARVQKAFAYPAASGPATYHLACAAAPTETNKSRAIATTTMNGNIIPFVAGSLPTHSYGVISTVADSLTDVAFGLSLPESPAASPPGLGGGWKDGTPWPAPDGITSFRCTVTGVTNDAVFTVDSIASPQKGITHVAWLSPTEWQLFQAVVVDISGTAGAWVITLDTPFTGIAIGCNIWPDAERAQSYVDAALAFFALMGPGEKSSNASALLRGFRHPTPSVAWPYAVGAPMLRAVSNAGDEIADAQFFYRANPGGSLNGNAGQLKPPLPVSIFNPPNIHVPQHLSFYRNP